MRLQRFRQILVSLLRQRRCFRHLLQAERRELQFRFLSRSLSFQIHHLVQNCLAVRIPGRELGIRLSFRDRSGSLQVHSRDWSWSFQIRYWSRSWMARIQIALQLHRRGTLMVQWGNRSQNERNLQHFVDQEIH